MPSQERRLFDTQGLALGTGLGIALLFMSFARIVGDLRSPAGKVSILQAAIDAPVWQTRLALNLVLFALALLALHVAFGVLCWVLAQLSTRAFAGIRATTRQWVLMWFLGTSAWVLVANASRFPHSSLGDPYHEWMHGSVFGITLFEATSVVLASLVAGTVLMAVWRARVSKRLLGAGAAVLAIVAGTGFIARSSADAGDIPASPNVIVIGIDSMRTDAVDPALSPALDAMLGQSARFTDAITPLARTFPSWVSILSGKYPHRTGAYMNLLPRDAIDAGTTLPQALRDSGYRAYYAIDETRFSNLDATFGFDRTITPSMGGTDFVLALVADTPLSNLVVNSRLGGWLFPHVHANRAAHFTYDPDSFIARIERTMDFDGRLMLAAHLTLAHQPFTWADSTADTGNSVLTRGDYFEAVRRVDQQFADLMGMLERNGALRNALVIVLSDHGEAIGRDDDLLDAAFPGKGEAGSESQRWGHGSSVFSPSQYHVVLGLRGYGPAASLVQRSGTRLDAPVSLIDIAPTVLDVLDTRYVPGDFDGTSLLPLLQGRPERASGISINRLRFTETEFNPPGFSAEHPTASDIAAAVSVYRLDPRTDRIEIRREKLDWIMQHRQFAALLGSRALGAAMPSAGTDVHEFVYVPLEGKANPSDRRMLREALQQHYRIALSP